MPFLRAHIYIIWYLLCLPCVLTACGGQGATAATDAQDVKAAGGGASDWEDLLESGELIAVAVESPETYYDEGGTAHGLQYALAADFAARYGLRLRVERAADENELLRMVRDGEADLSISPIAEPTLRGGGLEAAGAWMLPDSIRTSWAVSRKRPGLVAALRKWFTDGTVERVAMEQRMAADGQSGKGRFIAPPILDAGRGIFSTFDNIFREAAAHEGLDWRLLAAVGYVESAFDPNARSCAGAQGIMQLMPATARQLGVENPYDARTNIFGGAHLLRQLNERFSDVPSAEERTKFALASYNGGEGHIRDAQALCRKYGGDATRWEDVREYVLRLGQTPYRNDPVVRYGAMNGGETANYVSIVTSRYNSYGGHLAQSAAGNASYEKIAAPQPVKREEPKLGKDNTIKTSPSPTPTAERRPNRFTQGNRVRPADDPEFNAVERAERGGQ